MSRDYYKKNGIKKGGLCSPQKPSADRTKQKRDVLRSPLCLKLVMYFHDAYRLISNILYACNITPGNKHTQERNSQLVYRLNKKTGISYEEITKKPHKSKQI